MAPDRAGLGDAPRLGAGRTLSAPATATSSRPSTSSLIATGKVSRARDQPAWGRGLSDATFAVGEQLAARAATPSTRRQYAAIDRPWGLAAQRARPAARGWRPGWR